MRSADKTPLAQRSPLTDNAIQEIQLAPGQPLPPEVLAQAQPVVIRDYIRHWPLVDAAKKSDQAAIDYLAKFYNQRQVHLMQADAGEQGRLFYNDGLTGFNFRRQQVNLMSVLSQIQAKQNEHTYYVGSTAVDQVLPGMRAENDLADLSSEALVSIWLGNQSRIAAHYDAPDNIACVVAGNRRFTLFPPDQIDNLYVGPIDFTPAGQAASLVDFHNIDYLKYPKFEQAVQFAQYADLSAGDAIYIPSMWWHHIEAMAEFNILINYWWRQVENYIGVPADALEHAILSIRELPLAQRLAWQKQFEYYVFQPAANAHIEADRKGILNPLDARSARQIRAGLLNKLNR